MSREPDATAPYVRPHPRLDGVQIVDPIEDAQFALITPGEVEPRPCDTDRFYFPVDVAAALDADAVETPYLVDVWVRDENGELVAEGVEGETTALPPGRYNVELSSTGMKLYFAVEGSLEVAVGDVSVRLTVDGDDAVRVGVRSFHEEPAATVTTTDQPSDVMAAVSTLGSALKTTSPERSFPTLRGHPPLVERGDELDVPSVIEPPDTGVRIEVPPELRYVYPVAPLAYYLGAAVEPGAEPRLVADGRAVPLDGDAGFETAVARVLKQVFLFDCVTRTEGYYQIDLHERAVVEDAVDLDLADLYDRPLGERVRRYLDVPYEAIADAVPKWKLTADVVPDGRHANTLPFLANELAVVRCPTAGELRGHDVADLSERIESFFRDEPDALARSASSEPAGTFDEQVFRPPAADSIEQAYVGEGVPYGASKMTVDAYHRRLGFEPSTDPQISVAVVCNDEQMAEENVVSDIYGTRDWIDFDISFHDTLSTDELRDLLRSETDFLHYIGHVDDEGIRCTDGFLDAQRLDDVGVTAFFLNACNSYDQGRALVDRGALAGIATVTDVLDEGASAVGKTVARLLNHGFSLASTVPVIAEHEHIGHHYVVIGDGSLSLVTNESGTPHRADVQAVAPDEFEVTLHGYPTLASPLGSLFRPFVGDRADKYLNSGAMGSYRVDRAELDEFLSKQNFPVVFDGSLYWSTTFEIP